MRLHRDAERLSGGLSSNREFSSSMMSSLPLCIRIVVPVLMLATAANAGELPAARLLAPETVRITSGPFADAIAANRAYLLAHDPDRLLAPFRREAGLEPRQPGYGDWERIGLDGHTAGHYLSALAGMIAIGADTPDGELRRRLDAMVAELAACQEAAGDGYIGGVPGGRALWKDIAAGRIDANGFGLNGTWVPWYNLHKIFAGLRDAHVVAHSAQARDVLIGLGDWAGQLVAGLSDEQMQDMLRAEHGGMNEVLADIYGLTGDEKYLRLARRFTHHAVLDPLMRGEDRLTGLHANTQIPKVAGLARISALASDAQAAAGARFFWDTVTKRRSVAFGGNSVSEHFNDPANFRTLLEHREGPETCNTYNMLRLTEQLFEAGPEARHVDYYERALYNHILASIHPTVPGYVYFTPIRPEHYRVYSVPEHHFWCCVGSGMENPGRYGRFIYARAADGLFVNLFVASELEVPEHGLTLRQETAFPDEERTQLTLRLKEPATFTLHVRHPAWVESGRLVVSVNGQVVATGAQPSSYVPVRRMWADGDRVELALPMRTTVEGLPDGSDWHAILHGPIVMVHPAGTQDLDGLRAGDSRSAHIPRGPLVPLDRVPVLLTTAAELPQHIASDPAAGAMHFRLRDVAHPAASDGLELVPFFRLHDARYQMYWELTTMEGLAARQERMAAAERDRLAREAATLDAVAVGEQQPEVDHGFAGEGTDSGEFQGRRWRHGRWFQYTLDPRGETDVLLSVTYSGWDRDRHFDIFVNDALLATEHLDGARAGEFVEKRYVLPATVLSGATGSAGGRVTVRFVGRDRSLAGGIFDLRLLRADATDLSPAR
ncbi:MAG: glycoside hydrolase family 127 protein [Opitutaceae bacterium]|nr:glycoside hydrolase family 127 protein [Opitutaceae bacterium]